MTHQKPGETAQEISDIEGSLVPVRKPQAMVLLESAYLSMDLGQFEAAQEMMAGAAALMPKSEVPQLGLGAVEFNQGRFEKAIVALRRAQKMAPRSAAPRAHIGEALLFLGKVAEARKELNSALEVEPDSDGARFAQALLEAVEAGLLPPAQQQLAKPASAPELPNPEYPTLEGYIEVASEGHVAEVFEELKNRLKMLKGPRAEQGKKVEKALEHAERLFFYLIQAREKIREDQQKGASNRK